MTINTISTLPTAPARTDAPATFISRADAFLAALVTMQSELNTSIGAMNTDIGGIAANVTAAQDAQTAAELAETNAEAAQAAAEAASNATLWVSGTSYSAGDVVYSPVDYKSYRANTATSGTTDPSASADWTKLTYALPSQSGNAGKYLTTDGTNESWDTVSAGGVTTATASGAISAGDALIMNSDGTVSSVSSTAEATFDNTIIKPNTWRNEDRVDLTNTVAQRTVYDKKRNKYYFLQTCNSSYSPNYRFFMVYTWSWDSTGKAQFKTELVQGDWSTSQSFEIHAMAMDNVNDRILIIAKYSQNTELYYFSADVGDDGITFNYNGVTTGRNLSLIGWNNQKTCYGLHYNETNENFLAIYASNTNTYWAFIKFVDSDAIQLEETETGVLISGNNTAEPYVNNLYYSEEYDKYIFATNDSNSMNARVLSYSGTTITSTSPTLVYSANAATYPHYVVYNPEQDCFVFSFMNTSSYVSLRPATLSGTTLTLNTLATPVSATTLNYGQSTATFNDSRLFVSFNFNYTIVSMSGQEITTNIGSTALSYASSERFMYNNCFYNHNTGYLIGLASNGYGFTGKFYDTNINGRNFIGFSDAAYSDGQTVNVTVTSGVNSAQSGLTAGKEYFVNIHGELVENKVFPAGLAKSATSLLVK